MLKVNRTPPPFPKLLPKEKYYKNGYGMRLSYFTTVNFSNSNTTKGRCLHPDDLKKSKELLITSRDEQLQTFANLTSQLKELNRQNTEIKKSNEEIQTWMEFSNKMYEDMRNRIELLEKQKKKTKVISPP